MQDALSRFDKEATAINSEFKSTLNKVVAPPFLYHYTTDVGLRGILASGKIWQTDIFSLNDPSELRHGFSLAADALDGKAKGGSPECEALAKLFRNPVSKGIEQTAHFFPCSFSTAENDLGQWRAYSDDGRGYVIGFEGNSLEHSFFDDFDSDIAIREAFPVTYDDQTLVEIHGSLIESALRALRQFPFSDPARTLLKEFYRQATIKLASHVLDLSLHFKHPAFGHEREYRFLQMHRRDTQPNIKYRPRAYELIRYLEFDWRSIGEDVLKKIVVGPAADYEKARAFAQRCLDDFGFKNVEIVRSDIPYRSCH
jgi:hypothetical protein